MDRPLTDEAARALVERRAIVANLTPRERPEEPDRVVLRAVALPVASNDLLAPPLPARRATLLEQAVHRGREDVAALPGHRLTKGRVGGDLAQAGRSSSAPKTSRPETGNPALRTAKSRRRRPIPAKRHQVVIHGAAWSTASAAKLMTPRRSRPVSVAGTCTSFAFPWVWSRSAGLSDARPRPPRRRSGRSCPEKRSRTPEESSRSRAANASSVEANSTWMKTSLGSSAAAEEPVAGGQAARAREILVEHRLPRLVVADVYPGEDHRHTDSFLEYSIIHYD